MAKLFLSYSHKDEHFRKAVSAHLGVIERHHDIHTWTDRRIKGGDRWVAEIAAALAEAEIVILLVSQHSLTSDFILAKEIEPAMKSAKRIFPILVRDCDWQAVDWLADLQIRPVGAIPLAQLKPSQRDTALKEISQELRGLLSKAAVARKSSADH